MRGREACSRTVGGGDAHAAQPPGLRVDALDRGHADEGAVGLRHPEAGSRSQVLILDVVEVVLVLRGYVEVFGGGLHSFSVEIPDRGVVARLAGADGDGVGHQTTPAARRRAWARVKRPLSG